jgi:predicted dinucleotide-binding enzyme
MAHSIGILGTGVVAQTLGTRLLGLRYEVTLGTRDVATTLANTKTNQYGGPPFSEWHRRNPHATLGTFRDAASAGSLLLLCTNGGGTLDALTQAGPENFTGKTVVDITNPLDFSKGMPPFLVPQFTNTWSLGEEVQQRVPRANVVKTLNIVNCEIMVHPEKTGGEPTMFVAGNDSRAKEEAIQLLREFGWKDVLDIGDITGARGMEMVLPIWLRTWGALNNGHFGFKIVR